MQTLPLPLPLLPLSIFVPHATNLHPSHILTPAMSQPLPRPHPSHVHTPPTSPPLPHSLLPHPQTGAPRLSTEQELLSNDQQLPAGDIQLGSLRLVATSPLHVNSTGVGVSALGTGEKWTIYTTHMSMNTEGVCSSVHHRMWFLTPVFLRGIYVMCGDRIHTVLCQCLCIKPCGCCSYC